MVLAVPVFFAGGVAATFAAIAGQALALAAALALETLLWIGFTAAFAAGSLFEGSTTPVVAASMLGLAAMGVQSASVRLLMRGVASTNVMTTNTSQIAIDATQLVWARLGGEGSADAMRLREICRRGCGAACPCLSVFWPERRWSRSRPPEVLALLAPVVAVGGFTLRAARCSGTMQMADQG